MRGKYGMTTSRAINRRIRRMANRTIRQAGVKEIHSQMIYG